MMQVGTIQTVAPSLGLTLLGDVDFCDVTLVCGDGSHLPCHRAVLASASTFLRQILYESLQQRTMLFLGQVEVEEIRALLELLYTGTSSLTQDRLPGLQALATNLRLEALTNQLDMLQPDSLPNILEDNDEANDDDMEAKSNINKLKDQTDQGNGLRGSEETDETESNLQGNTGYENEYKIGEETNKNQLNFSLKAVCPICSNTIRSGNLQRHIDRRHKGRYKCKCDDCGKLFTRNENLTVHKAKKSCKSNVDAFPEVCKRGCGRRFKIIDTMEKHCRQDCPIKLKCYNCKEDFAKIRELMKHMKVCQVMGEVEDGKELDIFVDIVPLDN